MGTECYLIRSALVKGTLPLIRVFGLGGVHLTFALRLPSTELGFDTRDAGHFQAWVYVACHMMLAALTTKGAFLDTVMENCLSNNDLSGTSLHYHRIAQENILVIINSSHAGR
ncbi:hypothetical protein EDB19DRAFT_1795322 [Suillus lakei]|nr:hypothetical protein EDB19DRAFT_1795322 [Suillus lakei]